MQSLCKIVQVHQNIRRSWRQESQGSLTEISRQAKKIPSVVFNQTISVSWAALFKSSGQYLLAWSFVKLTPTVGLGAINSHEKITIFRDTLELKSRRHQNLCDLSHHKINQLTSLTTPTFRIKTHFYAKLFRLIHCSIRTP